MVYDGNFVGFIVMDCIDDFFDWFYYLVELKILSGCIKILYLVDNVGFFVYKNVEDCWGWKEESDGWNLVFDELGRVIIFVG